MGSYCHIIIQRIKMYAYSFVNTFWYNNLYLVWYAD